LNALRKMIETNTPIVFLANKQDIKGARSPEVIRAQNSLPHNSVIFPSSTKTKLNIHKSMKHLINMIYDNYASLLEILRNYENDVKGLAKKLEKNKTQMRDFLNNMEVKRFIEIDRIKRRYKVREGLKNLT